MFRKLRTKFILINVLTTSFVLVVAFSAIYLAALSSSSQRPPIGGQNEQDYSKDVSTIINERIHEEREASLESLLVSLIITGACIELAVVLISFYLAEQSIKPVRETYLAQKEFIANASHEIKTPLAVIQANLEAADIKGNYWIDNIATKTEELAALNAQLLTLARVEAGATAAEKEKVNLKDLVDETISPLEPQVKKQKRELKVRAAGLKKPEITVDKAALKQLLNILIDNAIKYSAKKITITISDSQIAVKNDGATIDREQIEHIFDRFYQTDKTKNGVGLGLAIAKKLADANGWKLQAESDKASTTFKIVL